MRKIRELHFTLTDYALYVKKRARLHSTLTLYTCGLAAPIGVVNKVKNSLVYTLHLRFTVYKLAALQL